VIPEGQLSISQYGDALRFRNRSLIQNLASSCSGLGKNGDFIGKICRDDMEIVFRKRQVFPKRPRMFHDTQDFSRRTMPAKSSAAPLTFLASQIDFTDNTPT
jgi:hypothetical protein